MKVPEYTNLEDLDKRKKIRVSIPHDRGTVIPAEFSGWKYPQEFTGNDWLSPISAKSSQLPVKPHQLCAKLVGLAEDKKSGGHPVYVVDPSTTLLKLGGPNGMDFGPGILDRICRDMFIQPGVIAAFSLTRSVLERFDYEHEDCAVPYWVSSRVTEVFNKSCEYNLCRVRDGRLHLRRLYNSDGFGRNREGAVRAVIVLQTKVPSTKGRTDIKWVEF